MPDLTTKQERFVNHYLSDAAGNAADAARKAGYSGTAHSLQVMGSENLNKPIIARAIREVLDEEGITMRYILRGMKKVMDLDPQVFFQVGRDSKATLADWVRLHELAGKMQGAYIERTETSTTTTHRIEIKAIESVRTIDSTAVERDTDTTHTPSP